jgi:hypothetical protein
VRLQNRPINRATTGSRAGEWFLLPLREAYGVAKDRMRGKRIIHN